MRIINFICDCIIFLHLLSGAWGGLEKVDYCAHSVLRFFRAGPLGHIDEETEIQFWWENSLSNWNLSW